MLSLMEFGICEILMGIGGVCHKRYVEPEEVDHFGTSYPKPSCPFNLIYVVLTQ